MRFNLPKDQSSIIKVIGVGGGGSNAVNYMYEQGITGVDFVVCNTDSQALDSSTVPIKIQLGATLTEGRGAGSKPEVGKNAAVESLEEIKDILGNNTNMVFVTAGMGGGTGTGAAPVIAQAAKELGILTVGIVTIPFMFEGRKRSVQAETGLEEMRAAVDTLLVIKNDKLRELYGNLSLNRAFSHADEVLCTAAKGIAEVITLTGQINVDMNDVNTVMRDSGVAIMGSGTASGENRAMLAVTEALESPLLNDNDITGANFVLLNITYGAEEVLMDEIMEITDHIQEKAGMSAEVIWGYGPDTNLESDLCVTIIATGFKSNEIETDLSTKMPQKKTYVLGEDELKTEVTKKIDNPTQLTPTTPPIEQNKTEELEEPFLINRKKEITKEDNTEQEEANELTSETEAQGQLFLENSKQDLEEKTFDDEIIEEDIEITSDLTKNLEGLNISEEEIEAEIAAEIKAEMEAAMEAVQEEETNLEIENTEEESVEEELENKETRYYDLDGDDLADEQLEIPSVNVENTEPKEIRDERPPRHVLLSRNRERESRIRELTTRLKTPSGLSELESEPAYKRKNVELDNTPHSSESSVSKYTLSEELDADGKKVTKLKDNNSFLHDNVD